MRSGSSPVSKPSLARPPGSAPRGMAHSHVLQLSEQWPGRACVTKGYIALMSHASRIDAMAWEVSINGRLVGNPHVACEWDAFYSLHTSGFGAPEQFNLSLRTTDCSFTISVTSVKKAETTDYPEMVSALERTVLLASPRLRTLRWIFWSSKLPNPESSVPGLVLPSQCPARV